MRTPEVEDIEPTIIELGDRAFAEWKLPTKTHLLIPLHLIEGILLWTS